ncbi:Pof6 interacting protein Sip1 [Schizosaccharomyces japonicus yFS275]|uniref:Pof6 interacting protein Sip1 n=1 Tax=Schizosaccharomyces japonicus (strain yFS275 / FY16936) TaxID=402676 RepID=B6K4E8_SCHJY|nr:Pof6 interacting protein Sip1 [Schizosaccharomyces japonicus yFS275]EEB08355.2 Pof6 interacting protein Sip1 [Schizosaccharomyces japonicus yFS275]
MNLLNLSLENVNSATEDHKREALFYELLKFEDDVSQKSKSEKEAILRDAFQELFNCIKNYSDYFGYPTRKLVGMCLESLYKDVEGYRLAQDINTLCDSTSQAKDQKVILNFLSIITSLIKEYGTRISQLEPMLRLFLRFSKNNCSYGLRAKALEGIAFILKSSSDFLIEQAYKDILKNLRTNIKSSCINVQCSALQCAAELMRKCQFSLKTSDYEWLKSIVLKKLVSPSEYSFSYLADCTAALALCTSRELIYAEIQKKSNANEAPPISKITFDQHALLDLSMQFLGSLYSQKQFLTSECKTIVTASYLKLFSLFEKDLLNEHIDTVVKNLLLSTRLVQPTKSVFMQQQAAQQKGNTDELHKSHISFVFSSFFDSQQLDQSSELQALKSLLDITNEFNKDTESLQKIQATCALEAIELLIVRLKSSVLTVQEELLSCLVCTLKNNETAISFRAAKCLQCFLIIAPSNIMTVYNEFSTELKSCFEEVVTPHERIDATFNRLDNLTIGLIAVTVAARKQPLYVSSSMFSELFQTALSLIKASSKNDFLIAQTEIKSGWRLLSVYVSLGPSFTRMQLSQLLLLWKNSLPKPPDSIRTLNVMEINVDLFTRLESLQALRSFLKHNHALITPDVRKRVIIYLNNSLVFLKEIPEIRRIELGIRIPGSSMLHPELKLMVRLLVFECFLKLSAVDGVQLDDQELLWSTVSLFSSTSVLESQQFVNDFFQSAPFVSDKYVLGSSTITESGISVINCEQESMWVTLQKKWFPEPSFYVFSLIDPDEGQEETNYAPFVSIVDDAIKLFSVIFCSQPSKVLESLVELLNSTVDAAIKNKDVDRGKIVIYNSVIALSMALNECVKRKVSFGVTLTALVNEFLANITPIADEDVTVPLAHSYGSLSVLIDRTNALQILEPFLQKIAQNRQPTYRMNAIFTVGYISRKLGTAIPKVLVSKIHQTILALCQDDHPLIRKWSLLTMIRSLRTVSTSIPSAPLSQLSFLTKLMVSSHSDSEALLLKSSEEPAYPINLYAEFLDCVINELGPSLQEDTSLGNLAYNLVRQLHFMCDTNSLSMTSVFHCYQHLYLFTPITSQSNAFVTMLFYYITNLNEPQLRSEAIAVLYQILLQNHQFSEVCYKKHLDKLIWRSLDTTPDEKYLKYILYTWLKDNEFNDTAYWLNTLLNVLSSKKATSDHPESAENRYDNDIDEDVVSLARSTNSTKSTRQQTFRWQTQLFAADCFINLLTDIMQHDEESSKFLASRVSEIVSASFVLSTSDNEKLSISGLRLLNAIITHFSTFKDPDFPDISILNQFEAQISSAITSTFSKDASPEVMSLSLAANANFLSSGLVDKLTESNRAFKTLLTALDFSLKGAVEDSSDNLFKHDAKFVLRVATLSAWAQLLTNSLQYESLRESIDPLLPMLIPHWISSLRSYSRLQFGSYLVRDFIADTTNTRVQCINPQLLLKIHQQTWLNIAEALCLLLKENRELVLSTFDADQFSTAEGDIFFQDSVNYTQNPDAFNFFIFGLALQSLLNPEVLAPFELPVLRIMKALTVTISKRLCSDVIFEPSVFPEVVDIFTRLVLTESWETKTAIIKLSTLIATNHPCIEEIRASDTASFVAMQESVSHGVEQLFQLIKIITLALTIRLPGLRSTSASTSLHTQSVYFVVPCLDSFLQIADLFPVLIRIDLYAAALHIYEVLLDDADSMKHHMGELLNVYKKLVLALVNLDRHECDMLLYTYIERTNLVIRASLTDDGNKQKGIMATLSILVLMNVAYKKIDGEQRVVQNFLELLFEMLHYEEMVSIAAQGICSMLLVHSKEENTSASCRLLISRTVTSLQDSVISQKEEFVATVLNTLLLVSKSFRKDKRREFLYISIPIVTHFSVMVSSHDDLKMLGTSLYEIVSDQSENLQEVFTGLSEKQKKNFEQLLKASVADA